MDRQAEGPGRYRFGRFQYEPRTGELTRNGHVVRLPPKPAELLGLLLASHGRLVTRGEIERAIWGEQPIDLDRSVNFAVRQVRSALGDSADDPVYIETLPRRGYRFIAPVSFQAAPVPRPGPTPAPAAPPPTGPHLDRAGAAPVGGDPGVRRRTVRLGGIGVSVGIALTLAGGVLLGSGLAGRTPAAPVRSEATLAVLPFEQLGEQTDYDYFVSGLAGEIINLTARLDPERLTVLAPTSSRLAAREGSDLAVAGALRADFLLRGSVTPSEAGVRVAVRLVDPADGSVIWASRYVEPVPTSPALEYEIAARVADALRPHLPIRGTVQPPDDDLTPDARRAYLEGAYLLRQGYARRGDAVTRLEEAVALDSLHAPSRAALGRALVASGRREEGRAHLARAVELDPTLSKPRTVLGVDALYALWDADLARTHFEAALALDPGNVLSHHPYAYFLSITGRHEEAIAEIQAALRLDPVSPLVNGDVGRIYYRAGQFERAREQCRRTLELQPDHAAALSCMVNIHLLAGEPGQALPWAIRSLGDSDEMRRVADRLRSLEPEAAMRAYWNGRIRALRAQAAPGRPVDVQIAQALVWLGRHEEAIDALEAAFEARSTILPQVPGDPCFAVLVGNPRFDALVAALGLSPD